MADSSEPQPRSQPGTAKSESDLEKIKIARARSDTSTDVEDENGPSSPHFYSLSVRQSSPSLDSYISDIENKAPEADDDTFHEAEDPAAEQQVHEQAVKLDLLRRQHSAKAKQTLEHLQSSRASMGSRASSSRTSVDSGHHSNEVSVDLVRHQSEQLKQASGDLKRLAEEQRTLAEEAVANFLLKVLDTSSLRHCMLHAELTSHDAFADASVPAFLQGGLLCCHCLY